MRNALYSDPDASETDDWFDTCERGGTSYVGAAVLVADCGDGALAGFEEAERQVYFRKPLR